MNEIEASLKLKELDRDMHRRADAGRCDIDLARIGFRIGDEFGKCAGRERRIDQKHHRQPDQSGDRGDIAKKIEIEFFVERCIDGVGRDHRQQRVAVRRRAHHGLRGDIAAGAGAALDHERLAQALGEPLPDQSRHQIRRAAAAEAFDDTHRPRRIIGRVSRARSRGYQRGHNRGGAGEAQEFSALQDHIVGNDLACARALPARRPPAR